MMNDLGYGYSDYIVELGKLEQTKQWNEIEVYAKKVVQKYPKSIYALKRLGIALVKQDKFDEAVIYYERAFEVGRSSGAGHLEYIKQLDILYRKLGRYEDAFQICSYYLNQNKCSKDAINRFARAAKLTGRDDLGEAAQVVIRHTSNRVPLGKPLPSVGENLENIPKENEIAESIEHWNKYAPEKYKGLMEAELLSKLRAENREAKGRFIFDDDARVYIIVETGEKITMQEVRQALMKHSKAFQNNRHE